MEHVLHKRQLEMSNSDFTSIVCQKNRRNGRFEFQPNYLAIQYFKGITKICKKTYYDIRM